jgi:hypothetical protein
VVNIDYPPAKEGVEPNMVFLGLAGEPAPTTWHVSA